MAANGHLDERPTKDEHFLRMAELVAQRGTCKRRQVGAVLVNARGHVLATGHNGRPSGWPHCNAQHEQAVPAHKVADHPDARLLGGLWTRPVYPNACAGADAASGEALDKCEAIHAEANALLQCHDVWEAETLYCTDSPCIHCVKLLLNTGVRRIVFRRRYPHSEAEDLWREGRGPGAWVHHSRRKRDIL